MAAAYPDIALIVLFEPAAPAGAARVDHVVLVMKDGETAPWFAAGKGVDGVAYVRVPGRDACGRIVADPRARRAGLRLYLNFCDARPLMFTYESGGERVAGEEIAEAPSRLLYARGEACASIEEFCYLWGVPKTDSDG